MSPSNATSEPANIDAVRRRLASVDQSHLFRYYDTLSPGHQRDLLDQIAALPIDDLPDLVRTYVTGRPPLDIPGAPEPAPYYPRDPRLDVRAWDRARFAEIGERCIRQGKVAAFTVAGGQGSRLGYDGPKGCYPGGPVSGKPLFQFFAESIFATQRRYAVAIPWYIMTSPLNHDATTAFFTEHRYFGLDPADVRFFPQGTMPSFDMTTGRILLADKHQIATNPDGHGGSLRALGESGSLDDMASRGIEHISYFQVDNPIVRAVDPVFIGLHIAAEDSSAQMSSKMVAKAHAGEKVGVFARADGRTCVIEYSDLPAELAEACDAGGSLRFCAGSIAIHMLGVDFVRALNTDPGFSLPYHRAEKKVTCINPDTGAPVEPGSPNAVKLERFVFDALAFAERSIVLETDRVEEFSPIKNASGPDSPESNARLQTERAARWLEASGVSIPRRSDGSVDGVYEISPLLALEAGDLQRLDLPREVEPGREWVIGTRS